jgi:hypothetical protein
MNGPSLRFAIVALLVFAELKLPMPCSRPGRGFNPPRVRPTVGASTAARFTRAGGSRSRCTTTAQTSWKAIAWLAWPTDRGIRVANSNPTIMAPYTRHSVESSRWRQAGILLSRVALAAGYGTLVVILPPTMLFILAIPIGVMLLATLWMLPDRRTFPLKALERVFPVYFILNIIWPVYLAVALPGLPWLTPTRMVLFVQTFLLVYSFATSGELRQYVGSIARRSTWLWVSFLAWEIIQVITLPLSAFPLVSAKGVLDGLFELAGVFFLSCLLGSRRGWATWIAAAMIVTALITSVDGFIELRLGYPPWANHSPSFLRVDEATMAVVLGAQARTADGIYRVHGPFPLSLVFAEYLALVVPFVIHGIFSNTSLARRGLLVMALIFIIATILITQSRLGLVGALVAVAAYPLMWAYRIWRSGRGGMLGPAVLFGAPAAVVLLLGLVLSSHSMTTRVFGGGAQSASDDSRRIQREMAIPKVLHNPLGYGLGNSGQVLGFTNPGGFLTIDSGLLTTVLDFGIAGVVAFFGLLLAAVRQGIIVYLETDDPEVSLAGPTAIAILVFFVIRFVLSQQNNYSIGFVFLGLVMGLLARHRMKDNLPLNCS